MDQQGHDIAPGTVQAEVIPVIRTISRRGSETKERPLRWVTQYWSLEGELLAEKEDENAVYSGGYGRFTVGCAKDVDCSSFEN